MICYDENAKIFHLATKSTSYVCGLADERYLGHIYYGPRIEDAGALGFLLRTGERSLLPSVSPRDKVRFLETYPMEYSCEGTGDFREACLSVRNAQGQVGTELHYETHRIFRGKADLGELPGTRGDETDCETLEITLADRVLGLKARLFYTIFDDADAVIRSVRVENEGGERLYLNRVLSGMLDMDQEGFELITLHGSWGRERRIQRQKLGMGAYTVESLRGESGPIDHPFFAIVKQETSQTAGEAYGMNLIYSGNFLAKAQTDQFEKLRAVMGIHPQNFTWLLEPGDSFQAPECVLVYSGEGIGGMTRSFHDLYREHLIPKKWLNAKMPVLVNNWEATMMNFDSEVLLGFAREAAKLGIDMLVMDDGWFGCRDDDTTSLGDWFVDERKLKGGLKPLVDEVNALGLKFGIWFEPEMVSGDSRLLREHPDWAFALRDRERNMWRCQYVLDLTRPEVFDGVYSQIHKVLSSANIAYLKWDMNRPLTDVGNAVLPPDRQGEIMHRFTLAVYRMQKKLLEDFPELLLENCSSGGSRFDPGMLYFSPQIWTSDDTDAVERLAIQEGTAIVYPLSTMGAHVSVSPNEQTGRRASFRTRGDVAMAGTFGYELDVRHLSEEDRAQVPRQIERFRKVNPVVRTGDYYRIASARENHLYDCWQVVSKDKAVSYATYVQVLGQPNYLSRRIRLQGLDPDTSYEVRCDIGGEVSGWDANGGEAVEGFETLGVFKGRTLMNAGLLAPRMRDDFQTILYEISRV